MMICDQIQLGCKINSMFIDTVKLCLNKSLLVQVY